MNSPRLLLLFAFVAEALCLHAEAPLLTAEHQFLQQLNSLDGIELVGGPFKVSERYSFGGDAGYFVVLPSVVISGLDQRLTVQTKRLEPIVETLPDVPLGTTSFPSDVYLSRSRRENLLRNLARLGFGSIKDEITVLDNGTIRARQVHYLPIVTVRSVEEQHLAVLLGAQPWQGIPVVKASFDRVRGNFDLERVREGFVPRLPHEIEYRAVPFLPLQTFYSDAELRREDWEKLIGQFSRLGRLPDQIIGAQLSDKNVTLSLDYRSPALPSACVGLREVSDSGEVDWSIELRAEFPRPASWWSFLPLLERPSGPVVAQAAESFKAELRPEEKRALADIALRLRGVGTPISLKSEGGAVWMKTAFGGWRGYELTFRKIDGQWRLAAFAEWAS